MKALIKKALWTLGYELHPRSSEAGQSSQPDASTLRDEVIEGRWIGNILQVLNRHYRPSALQYHRTQFGDDTRLKYITEFLDVRDQRILELGAAEGHHSILLEKMGVRENIAIESRPENLRKAQRIKEKYHLDRTTFIQGDLELLYAGEDLASLSGQFDLVFCLGVLYHLPEPGRGLEWMRSKSPTLFLGTHCCEGPSAQNDLTYTYRGKSYRAREVQEGGIDDPLSGMSPTSLWLYEDDLLRLMHDVGYSHVSVLGKDRQNRTRHITLLAEA
jgi:hypothetical protein